MYQIEIIRETPANLEQSGGKFKFWYQDENSKLKIFKMGRPNTGENWAEVVTHKIASLINLPAIEYKFAEWHEPNSDRVLDGVVSEKFLQDDFGLTLGNNLLNIQDSRYPHQQVRKVKEYKVGAVLAILEYLGTYPPLHYHNHDFEKGVDIMIGYLIFDCLIGNTDRHHENWGIVSKLLPTTYLAPSFDHASSLGRNESQLRKEARLITKDTNFTVEAYCARAKSAFSRSKKDSELLSCRELVNVLLQKKKNTTIYWLELVNCITEQQMRDTIFRVPDKFMTSADKEFALQMLLCNQQYMSSLL